MSGSDLNNDQLETVSVTPQSSEETTILLIDMVTEALSCDANDLPPLYEHVDPDALDKLFEMTKPTTLT